MKKVMMAMMAAALVGGFAISGTSSNSDKPFSETALLQSDTIQPTDNSKKDSTKTDSKTKSDKSDK